MRWRQWERCLKVNFHSFSLSPNKLLFLPTYFVKCRQTLLKLNSKGPCPSSEREIKFLRCLFTFFIKRRISAFSRRSRAVTTKKYTKKHDAHAKVLFHLLNLLFFDVLVAVMSLDLKVPNLWGNHNINLLYLSLYADSLRKQRTFGNTTTGFPAKWHLRNERRNSINWLRVTTQIWVVLLIAWIKFSRWRD